MSTSIFAVTLGVAASVMASDSFGPVPELIAGQPATTPLSADNFEAFQAYDPEGHARKGDELGGDGRPLDAWAQYLVAAGRGDPYGEVQFARVLLTGLPWQDPRHPDQPPPRSIDQAELWLTKARARGVPVADFYLAIAADPAAGRLRGPRGVSDAEISETTYSWPPTRLTRERVHPETWQMDAAALEAFYSDRDTRYQAAPHAGDALTPRQLADFGRALWAGDGVERSPEKGLWVLAQAAGAGDAAAMASLGDIAAQMGTMTAARGWYVKAAARGDAYAAGRLGLMQRDGAGGPRDPVAAIGALRLAADKGDPDGLFALAAAVERGEGRPKEVAAAEDLYRRAAAAGSGEAIARQADALAASRRADQAMRLWAVAADHGSPAAATRLASTLMAAPDVDGAGLRAFSALRMAEKLNYTPVFTMSAATPWFAAPYTLREVDLIAAGRESVCGIVESRDLIDNAVKGSIVIRKGVSEMRPTCDYTQLHPKLAPTPLPAGSILYVTEPPIYTYSKNIVMWVRRVDIIKRRYSARQCVYLISGISHDLSIPNAIDIETADKADLSSSAPAGSGFTIKRIRPADNLSYRDCAIAESGRL